MVFLEVFSKRKVTKKDFFRGYRYGLTKSLHHNGKHFCNENVTYLFLPDGKEGKNVRKYCLYSNTFKRSSHCNIFVAH